MNSSNPTLNQKVFENATVVGGAPAMTIQGTINKTLAMFFILLVTAVWTWAKAYEPGNGGLVGTLMMVGVFGGLIMALATTFKPNWAPITAPLYAGLEGLAIGGISAMFEAKYPGIVMQSVGLTFGVMLAMLLGYKAGFLQATPALRKGLMIAMGGLMIFYIVVWIASMFGVTPPAFINGGGPMGIAFSMLIIGMAAFSLILDFDFIEQASKQGIDKKMEWYGAFGLMVTLIWLYIEILRLLSKTNSRN